MDELVVEQLPEELDDYTPSILPRVSPGVRFALGLFVIPTIAVALYTITLTSDEFCSTEKPIQYNDGRNGKSGGCGTTERVITGSAHPLGAGLAFASSLWVDAHTRTPGHRVAWAWVRRGVIFAGLGVAVGALYVFDWPLWVGLTGLLIGPVIVGFKAMYTQRVKAKRAAAATPA